MATVYSLVCWGGRTGKAVTASNSSGLIFTSTNHGLRDGTGLQFVATTLPGNVSAATTYYAQSLSANTFSIYTEVALTNRVAWASAGTAVYAKSKNMLDYLASPPTTNRWGASGSERCYDGLSSFNSGRSGALAIDTEICELGEALNDTATTALSITVPAAKVRIESKVNGVRTSAFHYGIPYAGFAWHQSGNGADGLTLGVDNCGVDGWTIKVGSGWYSTYGFKLNNYGCSADNMFVFGSTGYASIGAYGKGVQQINVGISIRNCVSAGWSQGYYFTQYTAGLLVGNNIAIMNATGFVPQGATNMWGRYYGNISVGNTTNWGTAAGFNDAHCNAGLTGEAWTSASRTRITIATTDFYGYGGTPIDLRPATAGSPQVETSIEYYGVLPSDIGDAVRPNYMNGAAAYYDVGAYEFDHGYGLEPVTAMLTLTGLSSGTDVVVRAAGTSTILDSVDSTSGDWVYTYTTPHSVDIDIIKPGMVIVTFRGLSLTATSSSIPVSQQFDRNYL